MTKPKVEFWFEFASTYSYLSVMRLPALAEANGISVTWRPFLLGPVFKSQGWDTSPFNIYPAKGRYMWQDMARRCAELGLDFKKPDTFPQNGLLAARVAQLALQTSKGTAFCQNVYLMHFAEGQDISDQGVISACLAAAKLPESLIADAAEDTNKHALRLATEEAMRHGIFGAPSFVVDDQLFWGDDRLEAALAWAKAHPT